MDTLEKGCCDGQLLLQILQQKGLLSDEDEVNQTGTPFAAAENLKLMKHKLKLLDIHIDNADIANVSHASLYVEAAWYSV